MRFPAHVQTAAEILTTVLTTGQPADRVMAALFRTRRYIGAKDKGAISGLVYGVLRRKGELSWVLYQGESRIFEGGSRSGQSFLPMDFYLLNAENQAEPVYQPRLLLAALLLYEHAMTYAELEETFSGDDYAPRALTVPEGKMLKTVDDYLNACEEKPLEGAPVACRLNVPAWLIVPLHQSIGTAGEDPETDKAFAKELAAFSARAPMDVRVNPLKLTRGELFVKLKKERLNVEDAAFSPWGVRLKEPAPLFTHPLFANGSFEVQDEGSQLLGFLVDAKAGETVVDFCAGGGGKTLLMAASMENKGTLHACDIHIRRLEELAKRTKRAGLQNVRIHQLQTEHDTWVKRHKASADKVLVDAPCSGSGTWRRNPDARWKLSPERLKDLNRQQASILKAAAGLVKQGGRMVYATCSLLQEENSKQVEAFLAANPHFKLVSISEVAAQAQTAALKAVKLPADVLQSATMQLTPARHGCDGFFAAVMERIA